MNRNTSPADSYKNDEVRFQLSLLRLLYPDAASSAQVTEIEGLLKQPVTVRAR
jgi:hypothetical protein